MRKHKQCKRIPGLWIITMCIITFISFPRAESSYEIIESENNICPGEGFFPDPRSCTKFYRCVETFHFFYAYEFECPRRTIFDPDTKVCNHPYAVHPDHKCFIGNLYPFKAKEIIHVINDTTIHKYIADSDEISTS